MASGGESSGVILDEATKRKLEALVARRQAKLATLFRRCQAAFDLIPLISDSQQLQTFQQRCLLLDDTRVTYSEILDELMEAKLSLDPNAVISYDSESSFEEMYAACQCALKTVERQSSIPQPVMHLPKIPLKVFSGELSEFQPWLSLFSSIVDKPGVSEVQKMIYLISALDGEPLALVQRLPITAANYSVAMEALLDRYNSRRQIAASHVEKLLAWQANKISGYTKLRSFYESLSENHAALEAMKLPNLAEFILFHISYRVLGAECREKFEVAFNVATRPVSANPIDISDPIPSIKDLMSFLSQHCKNLESASCALSEGTVPRPLQVNPSLVKGGRSARSKAPLVVKRAFVATTQEDTRQSPPPRLPQTPSPRNTSGTSLTIKPPAPRYHSAAPTQGCPHCERKHTLYHCPSFRALSTSLRRQAVESMNRCVNCLGNHDVSKCASKGTCCICHAANHHTLLHSHTKLNFPPGNSKGATTMSSVNLSGIQSYNSITSPSLNSTVLLGTALVLVRDRLGRFHTARMLLDCAAMSSFLSKEFFSKLDLPYTQTDVIVSGVGQTPVTQRKALSTVVLKPRFASKPLLSTQVIVMDSLAGNLPASPLAEEVIAKYVHLPPSDPTFGRPAHIDGILGAEIFPQILRGEIREGAPGEPSAVNTIFGWVVLGPVAPPRRISAFVAEIQLDQTLRQFWESEEVPLGQIVDPETEVCEEMYAQHYRTPDGRYVVPLLFSHPPSMLGGSYGTALRRFRNLERRLERDHDLKLQYHEYIQDYLRAGHMRKLDKPYSLPSYIIPHHPVFNSSSSTNKMRPVFDGSATTEGGTSLNDLLHKGPRLQQDIVSVVSRFRLNAVAFTTDIASMYRQIQVLPKETRYQQILWRDSHSEPISAYEILVVAWGLRSSSYLACRTLRQLAIDEGSLSSRVVEVIQKEIYVDDIVSGANSVNSALQLQSDLITMFERGGFPLKKWSSNCPQLLSFLPSEDVQIPLTFSSGEENYQTKLLGLLWNPATDVFSYKLTPLIPRYTKRSILSDIARLYDPLGWVSPVIFVAKSLIQQLWLLGVGWDDIVPKDLAQLWGSYVAQLPLLAQVSIPRWVISGHLNQVRLIGFCDASERGFAAVIYLQHFTSNQEFATHLMIAKSRVAPLKPLSIPRLELSGAVLLAKLMAHLQPLIAERLELLPPVAFTDSTVVLSWLHTPPHLLKIFVANRVVAITPTLTPEAWRHVASADNPADAASRGLTPANFVDNDLWFKGPSWLRSAEAEWPASKWHPPDAIPDLKEASNVIISLSCETSKNASKDVHHFLFSLYSSFSKLCRVVARMKRAMCLFRGSTPLTTAWLSTEELKGATHFLVRLCQEEHFGEEIQSIRQGHIPTSLRRLTPFLDKGGLLRVGGRLRNAEFTFDERHPLLLPKKCPLTYLIIDSIHASNLHCGPRTLLGILSTRYWILNARQLVRARLTLCRRCYEWRAKEIHPLMADLPLSRISPSRPFSIVGTDFGGPFYIKEHARRNARIAKAYMCLFVCFSTKAVHLEAVSSLSTEAFLAALTRFVSRRGLPSDVYSDRGTNYVGANRQLTELHRLLETNEEKVHSAMADRAIRWHFNPPNAPHFGGLWEAGIKSAKYHLRRALGQEALTFELLTTLFSKVEAILNSRPLCALSSDPADLNPLTPGHFLTGGPLLALPEQDLEPVPSNRLRMWERVQRFSRTFWNRWRHEYVSTLMQRSKWNTSTANVQVNDIVLLNDGKPPPMQWKLARVTAVHPGQDGIVRVVTVRTASGSLQRPVVKLAPLLTS